MIWGWYKSDMFSNSSLERFLLLCLYCTPCGMLRRMRPHMKSMHTTGLLISQICNLDKKNCIIRQFNSSGWILLQWLQIFRRQLTLPGKFLHTIASVNIGNIEIIAFTGWMITTYLVMWTPKEGPHRLSGTFITHRQTMNSINWHHQSDLLQKCTIIHWLAVCCMFLCITSVVDCLIFLYTHLNNE